MKHSFKPGDVVRCIDARGCYRIHAGKAYKVAAADETCIEVYVGDSNMIDISRVKAERFVLIQPARSVRQYTAKAVDRMYNAPGEQKPTPTPEFIAAKIGAVLQHRPLPTSYPAWCGFFAGGGKLKFRSGCEVKFVAFVPDAKPHCQLVLLNPATGNTVTRYANGKSSTEPYDEPGDILIVE